MHDLKTITQQNNSTYKPYCIDCGKKKHGGNCQTTYKTATVTIGRNITGTFTTFPLTRHSWQMFKRSIINIAEEYGRETFVQSPGKGEYNGMREDNYTVVFSIDKANISELKSCLSSFCQYFQQECIALTIGKTDLIK